ncbi:hypothetical protein JQ628_15980 [Bradyrhizobium lablabi]|uniref:hypothetical protein n=1 Tax=Bradyrhizobium lablabi TaxID=722472 RepID=UPI001BA92492|nr:hypothetical protein [Bradyrhizobium lablabi]MBR1123026.1 hypothetical protein [Bradyrhizobium lablabi]
MRQEDEAELTAEHPLLDAVSKWPGRGPTQRAFEALGFSLHKVWQDEIIQFCGEQQSGLINRYWDEVAMEAMRSMGQCDSDERYFAAQPRYRSSFLDELFAVRGPIEPPYRGPPLLGCLLEHIKKIDTDREFRERRNLAFKRAQASEAERLGIDTRGGLKEKKDVIPFLEQFCSARGFEGRSRNRWRKKTGGGLVFEIGVWLGGNPFRIWGRLKFHIHHVDEPKFALDVEGPHVLERFVPGAASYDYCSSDRDYVLGLRALIELFDVIAATLKDNSPHPRPSS